MIVNYNEKIRSFALSYITGGGIATKVGYFGVKSTKVPPGAEHQTC